jgi:hypothetical protein
MREIAGFLVSIIASLSDPISWIGYIAAGVLIRNIWISVTCGVFWQIIIQISIMNFFSVNTNHDFISPIVGASIATLIVNYVYKKIRSNNDLSSKKIDNKPKILAFKSSQTALEYASKYLENSIYNDINLAVVDKITEDLGDEMIELSLSVACDGSIRKLVAFTHKSALIKTEDLLSCQLINRFNKEPFVLIKSILEPIYDLETNQWQNIRPVQL